MKQGKFLTDQYLEYRLEKVEGALDENEISVYFERDTGSTLVTKKLFLVLSHWTEAALSYNSPSYEDKINSLSYNEIEIIYDVLSLDCGTLNNTLSSGYAEAEIKIRKSVRDYVNDGAQITVKSGDHLFSGTGQILLYHHAGNKRELKARYFLAVNAAPRIKIDYVLSDTENGVKATLSCKAVGTSLKLQLLDNPRRLPCLLSDKADATCPEVTAQFESERIEIEFALPPQKRGSYYALSFVDPKAADFYLLNLVYEDRFGTLPPARANVLQDGPRACPYCGRKMRPLSGVPAYRSGLVSCAPPESECSFPKVYDRKGNAISKAAFCLDDVTLSGKTLSFKPDRLRLLPQGFYEKYPIRIALFGSTRAGKTAFLSRFFGLSASSGSVSMNARHLENAMNALDIQVLPAVMPTVKPDGQQGYVLGAENYYASSPFYRERALDVLTGSFPMATPSGSDCTRFPFVLNAKGQKETKSTCISFYDIPGEDARKNPFPGFVPGEYGGIFLFINAVPDVEGNAAVIHKLKEAKLSRDVPIAVILSKADLVDAEFQPSAHVIRNDYYDMAFREDFGKWLGSEILASSFEVKSYLQSESMILELEKSFDNVMYFALASFNFASAIRRKDEDHNEPGRMQFEDGTKRMELPLVWMLHHFGVIE